MGDGFGSPIMSIMPLRDVSPGQSIGRRHVEPRTGGVPTRPPPGIQIIGQGCVWFCWGGLGGGLGVFGACVSWVRSDAASEGRESSKCPPIRLPLFGFPTVVL